MKKTIAAVLAAGCTAMLLAGCAANAENTAPEAQPNTVESRNVQIIVPSAAETDPTEPTEKYSTYTEVSPKGDSYAAIVVPNKISGTVTKSDHRNVTVDNTSGNSYPGEIILKISTDETRIFAPGNPEDEIPVSILSPQDVEKGYFEAWLGNAMTMSNPPQNTPRIIIANIPEDAQIPQYQVAVDTVGEKNGKTVLYVNDWQELPVSDDVYITPYLTKNVVTLDDIVTGTQLLTWTNDDGEVFRIVILPDGIAVNE